MTLLRDDDVTWIPNAQIFRLFGLGCLLTLAKALRTDPFVEAHHCKNTIFLSLSFLAHVVPFFFFFNNPIFHTCFRGVDCVTDGDCGSGWFYFGLEICCDGKCESVCAELVIKFPFRKFRVKITQIYTSKNPQSRGFVWFFILWVFRQSCQNLARDSAYK